MREQTSTAIPKRLYCATEVAIARFAHCQQGRSVHVEQLEIWGDVADLGRKDIEFLLPSPMRVAVSSDINYWGTFFRLSFALI